MLYERIINGGTIDDPKGKPNPHFALPSTINWMNSLRYLVDFTGLNFATASHFYIAHRTRPMINLVENTVMEQLFLALHHLSALEAVEATHLPGDVSRIGVLAWYYGIYNAASAMIAAKNGSFQQTHARTAKMWDTDIAARGLAMAPFERRVTSLVATVYGPEIDAYEVGTTGNLQSAPSTVADALGATTSYLSGTADWYASYETDKVRGFPAYKQLRKNDFRTKAARHLRDTHLATKAVGFLHEAYRYRGKANYREAMFLGYGNSTGLQLANFVSDQVVVLRGFLTMAGAFTARKLGRRLWNDFVTDVDANKAFTSTAASIWV